MARAGGYILIVSPGRLETLESYYLETGAIAEPVDQFSHSFRAPLIVFLSFVEGEITHIASGKKGVVAGSGLVRLNLFEIQKLSFPVTFQDVMNLVPPRQRRHVKQRCKTGGLLPPASFNSFVEALSQLSEEARGRLERFRTAWKDRFNDLSIEVRNALGFQKESVGLALKITGFDTRQLLNWSVPAKGELSSFLDGLPQAKLREDAMIVHDLDHLPGFELIKSHKFGARTFTKEDKSLTVILANKLPLEQQFGTDLIYYNETYNSFVMVQYKAMEKRGNSPAEFRLPNLQLDEEVRRMDEVLDMLGASNVGANSVDFRLNTNPFYMKLCSRTLFNLDDGGLFPGMYLPIDYWKKLTVDDTTLGPRGGRRITYQNVGRKLTEADFVSLVANAWVGSCASQSLLLEKLIKEILISGKSLTLAVSSEKPAVTEGD